MLLWSWTSLTARDFDELVRALNRRFERLAATIRDLTAGAGATDSFAEGDTTPAVAGSRIWMVENAGATSITAFDGGAPGQEILLWATTANTTLVHSAALLLLGGVNVTLSATETRRFATVDGLTWRET